MSIETITAYRTADGQVFQDPNEALAYANQGSYRAEAEKFVAYLDAKSGKTTAKGARSRAVNIVVAYLGYSEAERIDGQ
ncbi:MAG: hypothetical protein KAX51_09705 [Chromatiaceae bacterium]|nr:hypothetical protein [Chromatiaceae bacterium]MBP8290063.1 hypothetical protein [Chromatiaceae bacterium]